MVVRIGVIGTNSISNTFMDAAKDVEQLQVRAVYSRSEETGRIFAEKHGIPFVYTSLEELAASEEIDAVYIASPNSCHCPQAVQMMKRGKHVLCEKPIASNTEELEQMLQVAKEHGVILLEAMRSVFDPGFAKIQELLPLLGTVRRAVFQYCQYSSRYDKFKEGVIMNAFSPELSNAAVMDIGVYCIHPMVKLFGEPETIYADSVFLQNGMEGMGTVVAGYDGMHVELEYSKISDSHLPSQIQGEAGTMLIWQIPDTTKIELHLRGGVHEVYEIQKKQNNMYYEIQEFARLISEGNDAGFHNQYSLHQMRVVDEIRHKAGIEFKSR